MTFKDRHVDDLAQLDIILLSFGIESGQVVDSYTNSFGSSVG